MAAAYRVDARRWSALFGELMDPIEARFSRPEPRRRVRDFVSGLLAPLPSKNCWTIAEHAGDHNPGGMQDLIGRASWGDALVRADVRDIVGRRLGHPDAILVIDETGDLKKGTVTVTRLRSGGFRWLSTSTAHLGRGVGTDGAVVPRNSSVDGKSNQPFTDGTPTLLMPWTLSHPSSSSRSLPLPASLPSDDRGSGTTVATKGTAASH